ncbi:RNA polymerase sigma factor [Haliangium sp.]|uniref:RNA polymerase sigma factor n=1 Tax=Haliangium sp. TaxID=2663208 RepID=UPI003D1312B6
MARDLVARCRADEPDGWRQLFDERAAQIYRWAVFLGLGARDAEDAAQEVLVVASRRIHTCRGDDVLTSWLYQITRRVVANTRRRRWYRVFLSNDEQQHVPAFDYAGAEGSERELDVRRCLARLPVPQRELLVLADIDGHTRPELAAMLGLPEGTVASRLRLARQAFRDHWQTSTPDSAAPTERLTWERS